jgi:hypothetical protein
MRIIAKRLVLLAAFLVPALAVGAQGRTPGGPPAEPMRPRGGQMGPMDRMGPERMGQAGPRQVAPRPAGVTQILNARRRLDLTPRQVAQLDSIERVVFAERRANETRLRALRDSMRTQMQQQAAPATDAERAQRRDVMRARMEAMRPQMEQMRGRDSTANAAAQRVLTDAQRQQLREIEAEERGRQRGMREAQVRERRDGVRRERRDGPNPMRRRR